MSEKIDKAMALFKERKYKEAIDAFSSVLETEPDNADVYNNMGVAYSCVGDYEQAVNYYTKAIELDPELAQAYINLSDLYYKTGDLSSALGTLQRGSYELPNNLAIAHLLARVYIEDQRWEDAIVELERVLDGEPENYDAYYDLGHVCFELGDYESAISNFEIFSSLHICIIFSSIAPYVSISLINNSATVFSKNKECAPVAPTEPISSLSTKIAQLVYSLTSLSKIAVSEV